MFCARLLILAGLLALAAPGCGDDTDRTRPVTRTGEELPSYDEEFARAEDLKQRFEEEFLRMPGVAGVQVGATDQGRPCLQVFLGGPVEGLPTVLEGIQIVAVRTETYQAAPPDEAEEF